MNKIRHYQVCGQECQRRHPPSHRSESVLGAASTTELGLNSIESFVSHRVPLASEAKIDIGVCRSVKITCISEVGWQNSEKLIETVRENGGFNVSQWQVRWDMANAAGSCSLLEVEALDGSCHKILIDAGWNPEYMRQRFAQTGVDAQIIAGEIDALFLTHEHADHMFGLQAILELRPHIPIYAPSTMRPEAYQFLQGAHFSTSSASNAVRHSGPLIQLDPEHVYILTPGVAAVLFDVPIMLQAQGEQSLYFNVNGKGLVAATGCCHQTLPRIIDFANNNFREPITFYGLYGGLHLAPFGLLKPDQLGIIKDMVRHGFQKIACNHCTGLPAVEMMRTLGYPVVTGSGSNGSVSNLFIGNGDSVLF
jgi:7,8-dihydropterin-6-yl-methyl-4-(beta-D-ribofuranosyl)aminobenzene 5'-phosphate synthase